MTGEEEEQNRAIKWRKHESIQRMDTAIPNTFKRSGKYDNFVQNTTGYEVDHQCRPVQSNVLDYIQSSMKKLYHIRLTLNFPAVDGGKNQEELPIVDGLSKLTSSGYREKNFGGSRALLDQIHG